MKSSFPYSDVQKDVESLVRATGQNKYFNEILPRLLSRYAEASEQRPGSRRFGEASDFLWLAGWVVSDYAGPRLGIAVPEGSTE